MCAENINLLIKSILDTKDNDVQNELIKIKAKMSTLNNKITPDYHEEVKKLNNAISGLKNSTKCISTQETKKPLSNINNDLIKVLFALGFVSISYSFINLVETLYRYTTSDVYNQIKENPIELKALIKSLPRDSYYAKDNKTYVYKNNEIDSEVIPNLVGSLEILKTISFEEITPFYRHISVLPLLGLHHPTGKKIFNYIHTMKKRNLKIKITDKLYHGRIRELSTKPLNIYEMLEAPYDYPSHGRANMLGVPALYFSNDFGTVIDEIKWSKKDNPIDGFEATLNRNLTMLDLRDNECALFQYCYFKRSKPNELSAYIVPNFIADCCRYKGIDGMIYNSVQNTSATNYVLFNTSKRWFEGAKCFSWDGNLVWDQ